MSLPRLRSTTALILVLAGCSDIAAPDAQQNPTWPSPEYWDAYGRRLTLSVFEVPGDIPSDSAADWKWGNVREPRIVLSLKTNRARESCATWLEAEVSQEQNVTTVTPGRVQSWDGPCAGWSPPTANFSRFIELSEGENTLFVDVLGHVFEYRVRVSGAAIDLVRVTPRSLRGVISARVDILEELETFWRFPRHSAAVYCVSETGDCERLFEALSRDLHFERHYFPAWGQIPFPQVQSADQTAHFRYREAADFQRLLEFLCRAAPHGSGRATIALSWRNEEGHSFGCS